MEEALLRFTVVSFLGKLIFSGVQGHFYASINIGIFKTLRRNHQQQKKKERLPKNHILYILVYNAPTG